MAEIIRGEKWQGRQRMGKRLVKDWQRCKASYTVAIDTIFISVDHTI